MFGLPLSRAPRHTRTVTTSHPWLKRRAGIALLSMLAGPFAAAATENELAIASTPAACATSSTAPAYNSGNSNFEIATPEQLVYLSQNYLSSTGVSGVTGAWREQDFVLTSNIDLGACNFSPIGDADDAFAGTFDGRGLQIEGLVSQGSGARGLFGYVSGGEVRHLRLVNVSVTSTGRAGGLAGTIYQSEISRVSVTGQVTSSGDYAGGIAGNMQNSTGSSGIYYSRTSATVTGTGSSTYVGGLSGYLTFSAQSQNSYSIGAVSAVKNVGGAFGGIGSSTVRTSYSAGAVSGAAPVGGFAGTREPEATDVAIFWDAEASGISTSALGASKTTQQMTSFTTFDDASWAIVEGWQEFNPPAAIWGICEQVNDGYPFLLWEYSADPCVEPAPSSSTSTPRELERADTAAIHFDSMISIGQPVDGHRVLVEGQGLANGMRFQLVLNPQGTVVASGQASRKGYFSENPTLPTSLADGVYTLTLSTFAPDGSPLVLEIPFAVGAGQFVALTAAQPRSPEDSTGEDQSTDVPESSIPSNDEPERAAPEESEETATIQELPAAPSAERNDPSNPLPVWPMVWLGLGGVVLAIATTVWLRRLSSVKSL